MTLTVRLPETIESQLTRFCEAMGVSKSQVVQMALKDWFAKPAVSTGHPLLAFVQVASNAAPSKDWAGPYSKERLRARVLASGSAHVASEPVAEYVITPKKPATRRKVATRKYKNNSGSSNQDKGLEAIAIVKAADVVPGVDSA